MKLSETLAIVTGAASGMGRHFALRIAESGGQVAAFDLGAEGLASLSEAAAAAPGTVHAFTCDVSDEAQVAARIAEAAEAMGGLNVLVNNAGIFRDALLVKKDRTSGDVQTMSLSDWQKVIDVDLKGPFLCAREFAANYIRRGQSSGVIVNISSISRYGNVGQTNYSAAKAGLVADTRAWAKELSRYGIRAGAIAPGFIETPILEAMPEPALEKMLSQVFLGRMGTPEEIWQGVRFIIECDYFTGRCIDIDGGISM